MNSYAGVMGMVLALLAAPGHAEPGSGGHSAASTATEMPAIFPGLAATQAELQDQGWLLHGQATFVLQGHPAFRSPYRDEKSLRPAAQARNTQSMDLILGRRLWAGAEFVVDAGLTRGFGLSNANGVAAFPSNEAFRLGSQNFHFSTPRVFLRQTIALSEATIPSDADPLRFDRPLPRERITITAGKISVWDIFDDNRYAHDARTQFLNWSQVGALAFDYTSDARGFVPGVAVEYDTGSWGLRAGAFQYPRRANSLFLDPSVTRAFQGLAEIDRFYTLGGRPGAVRLIGGFSSGRFSTWREITENGPESYGQNPLGYRKKFNWAFNWEQELTDDLGAFARASWNDARSQSFIYSQADRAISGGLSLRGQRWNRPVDTVGAAVHVGWLGQGQRDYLKAGGIGFIIGDGALRYQAEVVPEVYYDVRLAPGTNAALDYQVVVNPAYNAARGRCICSRCDCAPHSDATPLMPGGGAARACHAVTAGDGWLPPPGPGFMPAACPISSRFAARCSRSPTRPGCWSLPGFLPITGSSSCPPAAPPAPSARPAFRSRMSRSTPAFRKFSMAG